MSGMWSPCPPGLRALSRKTQKNPGIFLHDHFSEYACPWSFPRTLGPRGFGNLPTLFGIGEIFQPMLSNITQMCPTAPQRLPGTPGIFREGGSQRPWGSSHSDIAEDCWMKSPRNSQVCHEVGHPVGTSGVCPQTRLPTKPGDPVSEALRILYM